MNYWDAVILGIVEGLTEFLPVSSTGHLILTSSLLGISDAALNTFEIFIQLGAILAVVYLYKERFVRLFTFSPSPETGEKPLGLNGLNGWILLAITSLPIMVIGFATEDLIDHYLFSPLTVAMALCVGGMGIIIVDCLPLKFKTDSLDKIYPLQAIQIGLFQCLALWPGMSRSGSTIVGGLFSGLDRKTATEYSFIAAVPIMMLVTVYKLVKNLKVLDAGDIGIFAVGFVVSFIAAIIGVKFFVGLLQKVNFIPFGVYRLTVGVVSLLYFAAR